MFALPNTCIFVIKYAYPHYQIRIFVPHFVCIFLYADTINRPLQLLTAANYVANILQNTQRTPTKWGTNTPPGVGADSSCPYPDITNYTYLHYKIWHSYHRIDILLILKSMPSFHCMHVSHNHIYISDSPNPYICIIAHVFPHYQICIFPLPKMHFHITKYAYLSPISCVFSYMRAR